jgi:phage terminase large subunit GpA-like protein
MRDVERLREFYNTKLGIGWEERGESPRYERVSAHRRNYASNTILNNQIRNEAGSEILLLTCAVDVQKDRIFCHIMAWAQNGVNYTLDFRDIEGDTSVMTSEPWKKLTDIIENEIWTSDNKKQYRIRCTYIDAGFNTESVYTFCSDYSSGVFPSFGRDWLLDGVTYRQASKATIEKAGCLCFHVNTTKLKDTNESSFSNDWNTGVLQPSWEPNVPEDMRDDFLRQY